MTLHIVTRRMLVLGGTAALIAACAKYELPAEPALYADLKRPGSQVDGATAADMISAYRRNAGRGPVMLDPALSALAFEQAQAQARVGRVGHDVSRGPLDTRANRAGYPYVRIVENVAGGYHSLAEAFSGFRSSPGHNANMLNPDVTHMGIAVAQSTDARYRVYWSMIFAQRQPAR